MESPTAKLRVCIIGAAASGLPSIKACLEQGLEPVCFERTADIGGIWRFTENVDEKGSVMNSTVINSSKEMTAYSDFPPPKEWSNFYHNTMVLQYLRNYAKQFNLLPYVRFRTEVVRVERAADFARSGRWRVLTHATDAPQGEVVEHTFDAVMVCIGHHARPYVPEFKEQLNFPLFNYLLSLLIEQRFSHKLYGIEPQHGPLYSHPTLQDRLMPALSNGGVQLVRDEVREFDGRDLVLGSGRRLENLDVVFIATGYQMDFPFLEEEVFKVRGNHLPFYLLMFPPRLAEQHPTLAFLGFIQPLGAIQPIVELQARLAALVFKGERRLPSAAKMERAVAAYEAWHRARFYASPRHTIEVDYLLCMDELAEHVGCRPKLWKLFFTDHLLWLELYFGPATSYQWRLRGPNAWHDARSTILEQRKRIDFPMRRPALELTALKEGDKGSSTHRTGRCLGAIIFGALSAAIYFALARHWQDVRIIKSSYTK